MAQKNANDEVALKWDMYGDAAKALKEGIESRTIDPNSTPKFFVQSSLAFMHHNLSAFCSDYNQIKADLGVHMHGNMTQGKLFFSQHTHKTYLSSYFF